MVIVDVMCERTLEGKESYKGLYVVLDYYIWYLIKS